jgi:hypothetical protein
MTFGFIITRHVNSIKTNNYWNQCVKLLKLYYPEQKIIIIDDNSIEDLVYSEFEYKNITIIKSEYSGRGELLPYIYYLKYNWFDNAVIIHDSVFFHNKYDFENLKTNMIPLWFFFNNNSELDVIERITKKLNNNNEILMHLSDWSSNKWISCFGVMNFINYDFLLYLNNKYNLTNLLDVVKTRSDRCALERIFGIIYYIETKQITTLFGCINNNNSKSIQCDYKFDDYIESFYKNKLESPVVKVWTGR